MPSHWRSTRGRTAPRVDEDRSTGQVESSRRLPQTTQHAEATTNAAMAARDVEKPRFKRSFSRTREVDRPRTAGGSAQPTSNTVERPPRGSSRAYAAGAHRLAAQHLDLKPTHYIDEEIIGMALGSPGHPPFIPSNVHDHLHTPTADTTTQVHPEITVDRKANNSKPGKWKKFGGLFKPKHNPSIPTATAVPQTPQPQYTGQTADEIDVIPPPPLPKDDPKGDRPLASPDFIPADSVPSEDVEDVEDGSDTIIPIELPKLDVDIPDVQMDRYSVMFSTLLRSQQSTNLLARRSKVLEKLKTTSEEKPALQDRPIPQQEDPNNNADPPPKPTESEQSESVKAQPLSRRATSPTPGKSPLFSLFPQPPAMPRRAAVMPSQPKPDPLQTPSTAPSRLSPVEENFGTKKPQPVKPNQTKRRQSSISLVETSASTTQGPEWSTDGSCLSPTSSVSSVGDEILFDIKKLSMVSENQEPQFEVTKPDGETVELYRARSQKLRAAKSPALKLSSKVTSVEAAKHSPAKATETLSSGSNTTARSTGEVPNNEAATAESLSPGYLLPSTHFIPPTHVETAPEVPVPAPKHLTPQTVKPPSEVKLPSIRGSSRAMAPVAESPDEFPVEIEESVEASQDILAAAVLGTLDHMGEQSSLRAASPMPDSPGIRAPTPEKPVKLHIIPKNIPISKYSMRTPANPYFKTDPASRSASPQPRRAVTVPLTHEQASAARATKWQAAPVRLDAHVKTTPKSNSSSKAIPAQPNSSNKSRGTKPGLSIVTPKPTSTMDTTNSSLSPIEVTVARQVSLSRKQSKRLLIPPSGKKLGGLDEEKGEKVVNTQALLPVIVNANKAHRPGKSLAVSIVNI